LNFSRRPQTLTLDLPVEGMWSEVFSTHTPHKKPASLATLHLEACQAVLFEPASKE